jgi:hypothetical protein
VHGGLAARFAADRTANRPWQRHGHGYELQVKWLGLTLSVPSVVSVVSCLVPALSMADEVILFHVIAKGFGWSVAILLDVLGGWPSRSRLPAGYRGVQSVVDLLCRCHAASAFVIPL